jgi:prevent-host-death family protein
MKTINIHEAKTHLSRLVETAAKGESFMIAKAGRPVAMVTPVEAPQDRSQQRIGFLDGEMEIPVDFDRMGEAAIAHLFDADNESAS